MAGSTLSTGELIAIFSAVSSAVVALVVFGTSLIVRAISNISNKIEDQRGESKESLKEIKDSMEVNAREAKEGRADLHKKIENVSSAINKDLNGLGARVLELEVERRVFDRVNKTGG